MLQLVHGIMWPAQAESICMPAGSSADLTLKVFPRMPGTKQPAAPAGKLCMSRVALNAAATCMHACAACRPQQQPRDIHHLPWGRTGHNLLPGGAASVEM